jgi:hypothetical protein
MDVPTSEIGYTLATTRRGDHAVHKGHVVALENNNNKNANYHKKFKELLRTNKQTKQTL